MAGAGAFAGALVTVNPVAAALGADADQVTSPTFTLVHEYKGKKTRLIHLDLYRLDNFKYPTTEQGLQALVKQPNDSTLTNYAAAGYLKSLPKDPWGNVYQYASPGSDGRDYEIITYGRDGKPGGEGYDADISTATLDQK